MIVLTNNHSKRVKNQSQQNYALGPHYEYDEHIEIPVLMLYFIYIYISIL